MSKIKISVSGLGKRFNREWIFHELTYEFHQGKTYAITGPNGSGKSTLLQVLLGQMQPSKGELSYYFDDEKLSEEFIYQQVSVATPYMDLIEEFTLTEQLQFHYKTKTIKEGYTVTQVIESMYLEDARDKAIANFSSGMKQRLKLGMVFFTETPVVFLDEPGTNLDEKATEWYHENLKNMINNKLIVIASNQSTEYPLNSEVIDISHHKRDSYAKI